MRQRTLTVLAATALVGVLAGCGTSASSAPGASAAVTLRLGFFPNITHATAIAGVEKGIFRDALGANVTLDTRTFNAGGEAVEAIFSGALDATYIGPNPSINAFIKSQGAAVRIVVGATSGGAALVVRDGISAPGDLKGTRVATPGLGNTQDVALRFWLKDQGLSATEAGGGDVSILPQGNADALNAFIAGQIDGAWMPEPWATRMQVEGKGHVLVNERDLWPDGQFVTTELLVSKDFLDKHPDIVKQLIVGHVKANTFVNEKPAEAQEVVSAAIARISGSKPMAPETLAKAWSNLTFTNDPIATSLYTSAKNALALGFIKSDKVAGIYDLTLLNQVLKESGAAEIPQP